LQGVTNFKTEPNAHLGDDHAQDPCNFCSCRVHGAGYALGVGYSDRSSGILRLVC
jgi:hypothetical protein